MPQDTTPIFGECWIIKTPKEETKMGRIHYQSDFSLVIRFFDDTGRDVGMPENDFTIEVMTEGRRSYRAWKAGNCLVNMAYDGEHAVVVLDEHGLLPGRVRVKLSVDYHNKLYPDGRERVVRNVDTNVVLVERLDVSDSVQAGFATVTLPGTLQPVAKCECDTATEDEVRNELEGLFGSEPEERPGDAVSSGDIATDEEISEEMRKLLE